MDFTTISGYLTAAAPLVGVGIWALRTEGRVNSHDLLFAEREKHDKERNEAITERLARMESKMDDYFNAHKGNGA